MKLGLRCKTIRDSGFKTLCQPTYLLIPQDLCVDNPISQLDFLDCETSNFAKDCFQLYCPCPWSWHQSGLSITVNNNNILLILLPLMCNCAYHILYTFQVYYMKWFSFALIGFILYIYSYKCATAREEFYLEEQNT